MRWANAETSAEDALTGPVALETPLVEEPVGALPLAQDATVLADVAIDTQGLVTQVDIFRGVDAQRDAAVKKVLKTWKFRPAARKGKALACRIRVPVGFSAPMPVRPAPMQSNPLPLPTQLTVNTNDLPTADADEAVVEVTVRGKVKAANRGNADFEIDTSALHAVPRKGATDLLNLAPSVVLTNEGGDGHAEQVFLRGFDARQGQDIAFSVAGVPVNESGNLHGNGYADLHFLIPELVQRLRVVEGPFDPRQGNYAVAGSAEFHLGLADPGAQLSLSRGTFGAWRALGLFRPDDRDEDNFAAAEVHSANGYGQNRDSQRATALAQLAGDTSKTGRFRIGASAYTARYHSAGVVRQDDFADGRVGFFDTYDTKQGGDVSRYGTWVAHETNAGSFHGEHLAWVTWRSSRNRENFTGFLLDSQTPLQNPHGQRGDLIDRATDTVTAGLTGHGRWQFAALQRKHEVEIGYFARGDRSSGQSYRIEAATNAPYKLDTDIDSTLGDVGLYSDVDLHPASWLALRGGVRAEALSYNVLDRCAVQSVAHPSKINPPGDASCLNQQNFGLYREAVQRSSTMGTAILPRATIQITPQKSTVLSGSWGIGIRSIDPQYVTQDIAAPFASAQQGDVGVRYHTEIADLDFISRISGFWTHVDRDLSFSEAEGRNTLGGGSTRVGAMSDFRIGNKAFDNSLSVTLVRASFDDTHLLMPYIPQFVARNEAAYHQQLPWLLKALPVQMSTGVAFGYIASRPLPYGERGQAYYTADASASLRWQLWQVTLAGTNLFDLQQRSGEFNYSSDFQGQAAPTLVPARHFSAAPPRSVMLTLALHFGGEK